MRKAVLSLVLFGLPVVLTAATETAHCWRFRRKKTKRPEITKDLGFWHFSRGSSGVVSGATISSEPQIER